MRLQLTTSDLLPPERSTVKLFCLLCAMLSAFIVLSLLLIVKSSGELKSRGVKLPVPGKDNTNKLSLSKFCLLLVLLFFLNICIIIFTMLTVLTLQQF